MKISKEAHRAARQFLRLTTRDGRVNEDTARKIAARLIAEKPRHYLGILGAFHRMLRMEVEKRHAIVESATELPARERDDIVADLKKHHGADVTAEFRTAPDLLGGIRVKLGSTVWDGSVKARLESLRDKFAA